MAGFFYGNKAPSSLEDPDSVKRKREIVAALLGQSRAPRTIGEGISALGDGIVANVMNRRADAATKAGRESADKDFGGIDFSSLFGGAAPAYPSSVAAGASPTSGGATSIEVKIPQAPEIRKGLMDRGLPEHVADAFVLNFQDESGLNPGINEKNPVVAGSRGGYGLYQLTGSRRREYEAFAAQRGVAPSDTNAQLDFLMQEGRTTEKAAFDKILASQDTGSAAQAIVNNFLRPAEEHRAARAARYGQVANTAPSTAADAINMIAPPKPQGISQDQFNSRFSGAPEAQPVQPQAMQQPDQMQQAQADPKTAIRDALLRQNDMALGGALAPQGQVLQQAADAAGVFPSAPTGQPFAGGQGGDARAAMVQKLMQAAQNPWMNDNQRAMVNALLQNQMQQGDPMRQLQMQKAQFEMDALRAKPQTEYGFTTLPDGTVLRTDKRSGNAEPVYSAGQKPTGDMQEYEFAKSQGYQGTFADYQQSMKKAGANQTNVNVGDGEGADFYKELDKKGAGMFSTLLEDGTNAKSTIMRIDRLDQLLQSVPTGAVANFKQIAGNYGLKLGDDVDNIQAAQAIINQIVPQQRPAGSGAMSDADLELFKQSVPRIINTPGGNKIIIDTMRGIAKYTEAQGNIAAQVANRDITPTEGRRLLAELPNPLADLGTPKKIGSEAEFNALPSGAQFVAPDGSIRRKP